MIAGTSTITQDEYDALKITLAAREKELEWYKFVTGAQTRRINRLEKLHQQILDHLIESVSSTSTDAKTP